MFTWVGCILIQVIDILFRYYGYSLRIQEKEMKKFFILALLFLTISFSGCVTEEAGDEFTPVPSNPNDMV